MRVGDLFSGIGGFSLAARWMGWETKWFAEIDPYCSKVLAKHWPGVPNLGDLTKVDWSTVEPVDLMAGGFPCQDLSVAGKRKGITGERSGLWSEYARAVRALRPRWVVVENVPPLLTGGFAVVRGDLRTAGYRVARPIIMSASAVGALHVRERLWLVARDSNTVGAYPNGLRSQRLWQAAPQAWSKQQLEGLVQDQLRVSLPSGKSGGVVDGVPDRSHRLKGTGNAIVPHCALHIFRAIQAAEDALMGETAA